MDEPDAPERTEQDPMAAEDWPRTMGRPGVVPGGGDWRVALQAYVTGHDLGRDLEHKMSDAIRVTGRIPHAARGEEGEGTGVQPKAPAKTRPETRRVPAPERLDFHRSAGTWRRHLPLGRRGGRDARDDDTAR